MKIIIFQNIDISLYTKHYSFGQSTADYCRTHLMLNSDKAVMGTVVNRTYHIINELPLEITPIVPLSP